MPSVVLKRIQIERLPKKGAKENGPRTRTQEPGYSRGRGGRDHAPQGSVVAARHANDREGIRQEAHDQITEGLEALSKDYPEAKDLLNEFNSLWSKWMSGSTDPGQTSRDTPPPRMKDSLWPRKRPRRKTRVPTLKWRAISGSALKDLAGRLTRS